MVQSLTTLSVIGVGVRRPGGGALPCPLPDDSLSQQDEPLPLARNDARCVILHFTALRQFTRTCQKCIYSLYFVQFLPRDAMYKRSLCRRAVSVCPLSVTLVHCVETARDTVIVAMECERPPTSMLGSGKFFFFNFGLLSF